MKVLVACEESQAVCTSFRKRGYEAYSCDIVECSGGHPEWHIMDDVLKIINGHCSFKTMDGNTHEIVGKWGLIIAHPSCTYLTNAGAVRMRVNGQIQQERYGKMLEAKEFFMKFYNADCDMICIENPVPMKLCGLPPYTQIIQPYQFGHPYSKKTCLWLKNLPLLIPTDIVKEYTPYVDGGSRNKDGTPRTHRGCTTRSPMIRSKTFYGIAEAMAEQWGGLIA